MLVPPWMLIELSWSRREEVGPAGRVPPGVGVAKGEGHVSSFLLDSRSSGASLRPPAMWCGGWQKRPDCRSRQSTWRRVQVAGVASRRASQFQGGYAVNRRPAGKVARTGCGGRTEANDGRMERGAGLSIGAVRCCWRPLPPSLPHLPSAL